MEERALRVLEFTKIRALLAEQAVSPLGESLASSLTPSSDFDFVLRLHEETEEAVVLLTALPQHPLLPFEDITSPLQLAKIGSTLSPRALLDIASGMRAARAARQALVTSRSTTPHITALASRLSTHREIEDSITSSIISEDEISDHASPTLADVRRHIRLCHERVRTKLNALIHNPSISKYLQDPLITQRNDRYVIPVKSEYRQSVPGLVHDQSSTGATLFIEPMAVVEIGNDLKQRLSEERREIERILQSLTTLVSPHADSLISNLSILSQLDLIFSKGRLSRLMRATQPKLNREGRVRIIRGRHPLLDPSTVVPIDLWMGDLFTTLVITGPNTGGKTVTLKTIGLFTLMAQSGLQLPADFGTETSVFGNVFADIGDEQSIEQSLSTFSAHMTNIVDILLNVTPDSLALFDELGAGTDPTEGAALAQAILRTLLQRKIRTLATTHYSELKAFALTTEGVENASAEFDVETLRPTYRLTIGVPGKSNAFEISRRLGLPASLIDEAKTSLTRDQIRFEDVIANAEYHRKIAERERLLAEDARVEMQKLRDQAESLRASLENAREKSIADAKREARRIMESAKQEADSIVSQMRKIKSDSTHPAQAEQLRQRLREGADALADSPPAPEDYGDAPTQPLKIGDVVYIPHLNTTGKVLEKPNAKGETWIQAGALRLSAPTHTLRLAKAGAPGLDRLEKQTTHARALVNVGAREVRTELDLRGLALDEALPEVDSFLDDATLSSLGEVSIIHGKGAGTLRAGIAKHLRNHPHAQEFRLGKFGEGESGVTIVKLK
ncbi:MAG: endonuclease MutS2 [Oscillospiraceae bacterium]|jgi:DNA mismatch repair protein MutS2|nr:endonuclease MutS2 [Oscillospiraceae bacterium]